MSSAYRTNTHKHLRILFLICITCFCVYGYQSSIRVFYWLPIHLVAFVLIDRGFNWAKNLYSLSVIFSFAATLTPLVLAKSNFYILQALLLFAPFLIVIININRSHYWTFFHPNHPITVVKQPFKLHLFKIISLLLIGTGVTMGYFTYRNIVKPALAIEHPLQLVELNLTTKQSSLIRNNAHQGKYNPQNPQVIAFLEQVPGGYVHLKTFNLDTQQETTLVKNQPIDDIAWTTDGQQILISRYQTIELVSLTSHKTNHLSAQGSKQTQPRPNPNGQELLFKQITPKPGLYKSSLDLKNIYPVKEFENLHRDLKDFGWVDQQRSYYVSQDQLVILSKDGQPLQSWSLKGLSGLSHFTTHPQNSDQLVFKARVGAQQNIQLMTINLNDGTVQIWKGLATEDQAFDISPDGTKILLTKF